MSIRTLQGEVEVKVWADHLEDDELDEIMEELESEIDQAIKRVSGFWPQVTIERH